MKLEPGTRVRLISVEEILKQEARSGYGLHPPLKVGDLGMLISVAPDELAECAFAQGHILVSSTMVEPAEGVFVTKIVPPETGWPIAMHCRHCRKTVFMHSMWAAKPERGDYFQMELCADSCQGSVAELLTVPMMVMPGMLRDDDPWATMAERHRKETAKNETVG